MKNYLRILASGALVLTALAVSSCAYDPYYSSASVGGSYNSGYNGGYGYSGGYGGSTSVFIGTGDPHWGYDPTCYSYYDYRSSRYYDPYNYGYYPIGYRPRAVYGISHPYGWRAGGGYIRPPGRVYDRTVSNYRGRSTYDRQRQSGYDQNRVQGDRTSTSRYSRETQQNSSRREEGNYRPTSNNYRERQRGESARPYSRSSGREESGRRQPSRYNTPVRNADRQPAARQENRRGDGGGQREQKAEKENGRVRGYR